MATSIAMVGDDDDEVDENHNDNEDNSMDPDDVAQDFEKENRSALEERHQPPGASPQKARGSRSTAAPRPRRPRDWRRKLHDFWSFLLERLARFGIAVQDVKS